MEKFDALLVQSVILLDRQYLLTDHLLSNNCLSLKEFEQAIAHKQQALNHVLDVYNYVFALIDHLVRYQKIAFSIPKLNQRSAEYRALSDAMGELKDIRNQLQHINNNIENCYTGPLLGSVCWVSNNKQFIASFNEIGRSRSVPSLVFDVHTGAYIQNFCYVYNDKHHDLEKAIMGMHVFNKYINSLVRIETDGKIYDAKDHFAAMCIDFKMKKLEPSDA